MVSPLYCDRELGIAREQARPYLLKSITHGLAGNGAPLSGPPQ
jgi:hypothetical protein